MVMFSVHSLQMFNNVLCILKFSVAMEISVSGLLPCAVYGSDPSFVFCTATSANPREHCMVKIS